MNDKTAYLGDRYSFSHAAAVEMSDGELIPFATLTQTLAACGTTCNKAVVPVENNVEGAVNEVYDALFDSGLYIEKQLVLPVRHSLIVKSGTALGDIRRVVSHPQAIGQCRRFLAELGVTVVAAPSTSEALKCVDEHTAAIALMPRDGQQAIARGIQDSAVNATRFSLLTAERSSCGGTVSTAFDLNNAPGALLEALRILYSHGINLTRILSRPHRDGSGKYRFFVDFDFAESNDRLFDILDELSRRCVAFRFLGRYDVAAAKSA